MGLNINKNLVSLGIQRNLVNANTKLATSLLQLSSGQRINSGADDPAGLTISELLRTQLESIAQANENTQYADNLISTAEGALNETSLLLVRARELAVKAANTGTMDKEQQAATQAELNSILNQIDRIGNTTKYGSKSLLNGNADFDVANVDAGIERVDIQTADPNAFPADVTIRVDAEAAQADAGAIQDAVDDTTIKIAGSQGSVELSFAAGTSAADIAEAINAESENTGVAVEGGNLVSTEVGSEQYVDVETIEGSGVGVTEGKTEGADVEATVNGEQVSAQGNTITIDNGTMKGEVSLADTVTAGDELSFEVEGGGLVFQLGGGSGEQRAIGISAINTSSLGETDDGALYTLRSGGDNSMSENPSAALRIIDQAISDIATTRAELGAFQTNTLQTNVNALDIAFENLTASESRIRDLDYAIGIMSKVQAQIQQNAGISLMSQSNLSRLSILQLLG